MDGNEREQKKVGISSLSKKWLIRQGAVFSQHLRVVSSVVLKTFSIPAVEKWAVAPQNFGEKDSFFLNQPIRDRIVEKDKGSEHRKYSTTHRSSSL